MNECGLCGETVEQVFEFKDDDEKLVFVCERCIDTLIDDACKWRGEQ